MVAKIITIIVNFVTLNKMLLFYADQMRANTNEYVVFLANSNGTIVTAYKSKKEDSFKVTFSGESPLSEARIWDKSAKFNAVKEVIEKGGWINSDSQIGSDEVGTGDFFGPISVCATYVSKSQIKELQKLGVTDSKKVDDRFILELVPKLLAKYEYSQISLDNEKYNKVILSKVNMNEIKARMHNQALLNLKKKHPEVEFVFVDQFAPASLYYRYLKNTDEVVQDITFRTKGESYFPSVALASFIARYSFLKKMQELSKKYRMTIPFGASGKVDEFADKFIEKYGINELNKIVKMNFKNYDRLVKKDGNK